MTKALLVIFGFVWAVFLCCLYTWGGEAGQHAAKEATGLTFLAAFVLAFLL